MNLGLNELEEGLSDSVLFFIQDICGTDEQLKDSAQVKIISFIHHGAIINEWNMSTNQNVITYATF